MKGLQKTALFCEIQGLLQRVGAGIRGLKTATGIGTLDHEFFP